MGNEWFISSILPIKCATKGTACAKKKKYK